MFLAKKTQKMQAPLLRRKKEFKRQFISSNTHWCSKEISTKRHMDMEWGKKFLTKNENWDINDILVMDGVH